MLTTRIDKNNLFNKLNKNDGFLMELETSFDLLRVILVGRHIVIFLKRKYLKDERHILCMIQKAWTPEKRLRGNFYFLSATNIIIL